MEQIQLADQAVTRRTPWFVLAALGFAVFASVTAELLPPAVMLGMSATLGVGPSAIGSLVTVWAAAIVIGTVPVVRLTSRLPRKPLLIATLGLFAVASLVIAVVPVFAVVVVGRIVSAVLAALAWAVIFGYVPTLVSPDRIGRAMAVVLGGGTLASVLGVPIGAYLAALGAWPTAFVAVALALAVAAAVVARWLPRQPGTSAERARRVRLDPSARGVLALLAAGALLLTGYMTLYGYIVPVLVERIGFTRQAASGVLLAAGAAGALGILLSGVVGDRWPRAALLAVVAAIPAGSSLVLVALLTPAATGSAVAGVTLIGFGIGGLPPLFQARVTRAASPALRALAAGAFVVVLNVGIALGSAVGAAFFAHRDAEAVAVIALALSACALVVFAVTTATVRNRGDVG